MKSILIVDDEYALVESLVELFEEEGYRVRSAGNVQDAMALVEDEAPDLLLTDFTMPLADGGELVRRVREVALCRSLPVIMMSATVRHIALGGGTLTVSTFLKKPFRWEVVLGHVEELIGAGKQT